MSNFYEILNVPTTASTAEIQTAYEQQYNQWRRLVTHHDPNVVNQANQALQALETIRATLTDPTKRSAYDAGIGLGSVSGLANPEALLRMSSPSLSTSVPPRPPSVLAPGAKGLWVCPKCGIENPEHTQFCFSCATQLVRECPKCKNMSSLVFTGICGKCGTHYETFVKLSDLKRQQRELVSNRMAVEQEISRLSSQVSEASKTDYGQLRPLGGTVILLPLGGLVLWGWLFNSSTSNCAIGLMFGGLGSLLAVLALTNFRNAESRRRNLLNEASENLEFKKQQLFQVQAQIAGLNQAIRDLG